MINNSEHKGNLWKFTTPKTIRLGCGKLPFYYKTSIKWRGLTIHIRLDADGNKFSYTHRLSFIYKDKLYHCGFAQSKGRGGRLGYFPEISTATHKLKIIHKTDSLTLTDELIESINEVDVLENPFEIFKTPENILFEEPKLESKKESFKPEIKKNQVTLYEYKDNNININSFAYFEKENLVIDYWKLGSNYEDEYFTLVKKEHLDSLYKEFEIENENKAELLIGLMNAFKGENCFEKIKDFLKLKNISFENSVRR